MNLEQLRKLAKELVRAARAGDAEALARLDGREPILARAQLVLAREQCYPSWAALVAAAEANAEALVLGREWPGDPNAPGGPRGWAPLLYVCHSVFASAAPARVLLERGADPDAYLDPADAAVAAIAHGERPATPVPTELDPDAQEVLILAALRGHLDLVVEQLGPDFRGVVGGSPEGTLLHHAAWVGSPALVERLLELGADPIAGSGAEFDSPLAWAALASQYHEVDGRHFVAVAELLTAAGNHLESRFLDVAEGPLYDWLDERLG